MTAPKLSPVRRIEAKRLLVHLFAHEQLDAEVFIDKLAAVMIDVPEVVQVAARHLEDWNNFGQSGHTVKGTPRFTMSDTETGYEAIAEVVLDAAAIYRGETTEVMEFGDEYSNAEAADLLTYKQVIRALTQVQTYLRAIASRVGSRTVAESHASQLHHVVLTLQAQHHE